MNPDPGWRNRCDAGPVSETPAPGAPPPPPGSGRAPLVRVGEGRLLAGVATGIARHLGVDVTIVRLVFALLLGNGVGAVAYLAVWLLVPADDDDGSGSSRLRRPRDLLRAIRRDRPGDPEQRLLKLTAYLLLAAVAGSVLNVFGLFGSRGGGPILLAAVGAALIWWQAPQAQRDQWTRGARRYRSVLGSRRGSVFAVLAGIALVVLAVTAFLAAHDALAAARAGALAIGATLVGVVFVTGPWLLRLLRELTAERRARIREHERAELATHVHDSVLQTLALIQSRAGEPDAVRRLARRQERELREWLFAGPGEAAGGTATFAAALRTAAADVEDGHDVSIDVVVVGDAAVDEAVAAIVAAAREAMVNAAKSSGARAVSVFAEVDDHGIAVFVRDRGRGFDPASVPADRRGIRDSIVGRMARHGGTGTVRSSDAGTEVELRLAGKVKA
jgi:signal transduction histidine kinase/phage shock protein PspC (stress-responsive transcriptional regulator)